MKKRILIAILLLVCAACCAIGLTACKTKNKNEHGTCSVHTWSEWTETAATCDSAGFEQHFCTVCGSVQRKITAPAIGHAWSEWKIDKATCDDDGQHYRQCSNCNRNEKIPIPKKGHAYEKLDWVWIDEKATAVFTCINDENHVIRVDAEITDETTKKPSFTEDGEITYTATVEFGGKRFAKQKVESVPKLFPPYTVGLAYSEIKNGNEIVAYSVMGKGSAVDTEITVPETYNNKPVSQVSARAFYGENITKLSLPSSVKKVGSNAFCNCSALTDITLPDSIQSIGSGAFTNSGYYNDASNWENSALYIDNHLISVKSDIAGAVNVKEGTVCIAENAIRFCLSLTDISVPASVTAIGYNSIYGCTEIENIMVNANNIKYSGAGNCLIEISTKILIVGCKNSVIPTDGSVETIYDRAFENIGGLTDIVIPDSVTKIGQYAYNGCSNLETVTFGNKLETIGSGAFNICTKLKSINLPATVNEIEYRAFYGCGGLESISVNTANPVYSGADNCLIEKATKTLIRGCRNSIIPDDGSVEIIDESAFFMCRQIETLVIPDSVTTICEDAFSSCVELKYLTVGSGVTYIGRNAFYGITEL
ncbi:MAG: leucine-rich repeat domain-containing protein, partial [Clostridia bacterium]|nr:leucine-rich repeat domain-containing protein [Clostridia bacterium]